MNEVALRQSLVGLLDIAEVGLMKLDSHAHPHVLRALTGKEVTLLQGLEPEVVKHKITIPTEHRRIGLLVGLDILTVGLRVMRVVHNLTIGLVHVHLLMVVDQNTSR